MANETKSEPGGLTNDAYDQNYKPEDKLWIVKHINAGAAILFRGKKNPLVAVTVSEADGHRLKKLYIHEHPDFATSIEPVELTKQNLDDLATKEGFDLVIMTPNDLHKEFTDRGLPYP